MAGELTMLCHHEESHGHEREERASREGGPSEPTEVETDDAGPLAVSSELTVRVCGSVVSAVRHGGWSLWRRQHGRGERYRRALRRRGDRGDDAAPR